MIIVALFMISVIVKYGFGSDNTAIAQSVIQMSLMVNYLVTSTFYIIQKQIDKKKEKAENDDFTENS